MATTSEQIYGKDAAEWLARWDAGDSVHTIEMGGMGPGYEQAIQMQAAEFVRTMLKLGFDAANEGWAEPETGRLMCAEVEKETAFVDGLSGAQCGAAMSLACHLVRHGPTGVMADDRVKDRHIMASKGWPSLTTGPAEG